MPTEADKEPSPRSSIKTEDQPQQSGGSGVVVWLKNLLSTKPESDESLREVLEDYIEEMSSMEGSNESAVSLSG